MTQPGLCGKGLCACRDKTEDELSEGFGREHMNGCSVCVQPKNWTNNVELQQKWDKAARCYWFRNGQAYMELCPTHWTEVRAWLNGEAAPAQVEAALAFLAEHSPKPPAAPSLITLEAFA